MTQIRKELGTNAVILSSKEIQEGGFLGLFKKRKVEVVAALDRDPVLMKQQKPITKKPEIPINTRKQTVNHELMNEIKNMRLLLEQQSLQQQVHKYPLDYQTVYHHLIEQEVKEEIATSIMESVIKQHENKNTFPKAAIIAQDVKQEMESRLSNLSFKGISKSARVVHFVGPTGVGKTTTIAKVAAKSMLQDKKSVAFITMDTYRIAAIEQLKTYAKILDNPVEVVYSPQDYQEALEKFRDHDLILVDTAGRNYRDEQYVEELTKNIKLKGNVENYLVLSLTAKPKDIIDIFHSFRHIDIKGLIFTKIDETRQYGSLLNIPLTHQLGIAYITNGQEVPDNIVIPSKEVISNYIVGDLIDS